MIEKSLLVSQGVERRRQAHASHSNQENQADHSKTLQFKSVMIKFHSLYNNTNQHFRKQIVIGN